MISSRHINGAVVIHVEQNYFFLLKFWNVNKIKKGSLSFTQVDYDMNSILLS